MMKLFINVLLIRKKEYLYRLLKQLQYLRLFHTGRSEKHTHTETFFAIMFIRLRRRVYYS